MAKVEVLAPRDRQGYIVQEERDGNSDPMHLYRTLRILTADLPTSQHQLEWTAFLIWGRVSMRGRHALAFWRRSKLGQWRAAYWQGLDAFRG